MGEVISKASYFFILFPSLVAGILTLSIGQPSKTQNPEFTAALDAFKQGQTAEAKQKFSDLIQDPKWTFPALYNLGNVAMQQNRLGEALGYYKRAKFYSPFDRDVRHNIKFIEENLGVRRHSVQRWDVFRKSVLDVLPVGGFFAVFLFTLSLFFFALRRRILEGPEVYKGALFITATILFGLAGFLTAIKLVDFSYDRAVITEAKVELKSGPGSTHATLLEITEGLEVTVDSKKDEWAQVSLNDEMTGWIPITSLMEISRGG